MVSIPADGVLVTGDLVHDLEPLFQSSHPRDWLETARKVRAMPFEVFVGGHGNAHRGKDIMDRWIGYVSLMIAEIDAARLRGQTLEDARATITGNLLTWLARDGNGAIIQRTRESLMTEWIINPLEGAVGWGIEMAWARL